MKLNEKIKAVTLRKRGMAYNKILKKIKVSKSTLSLWLREVVLNEAANKKLLKGRELSRYFAAESRRKKRLSDTATAISMGRQEFHGLMKKPLFLAGLCLYWAEGDKHKQEKVKFTNSDEKMILLMMKWFREICGVPEQKFRIALHVHNLHITKNVKRHWSEITGVSENQFQKTYVKHSTLRYRRNALYNGTCAIVVHNNTLFRRICGWKIGMLEHFSISPRSSTDRTRDF